jgi:hypothetical protein
MTAEGPAARVGLRLLAEEDHRELLSPEGLETAWTVTDDAGYFHFYGIPPGNYRVTGRVGTNSWTRLPGSPEFRVLDLIPLGRGGFQLPARPAAEDLLWADTAVVVDSSNVEGVTVMLRPGLRVTGRFEFRGTASRPTDQQIARMGVTLVPLDSRQRPVMSGFPVGGRFTTAPFPSGRYQITARHPDAIWHVDSILVNGQEHYGRAIDLHTADILDILVVLTDRLTTLSGSVRGATTHPATVILFPADVEAWIGGGMVQRVCWRATVSSDGSYTFRHIRPGHYHLVALRSDGHVDLENATFISRVATLGADVYVRPGDNRAPAVELGRSR